jgi:hypothetical protein
LCGVEVAGRGMYVVVLRVEGCCDGRLE